MFSIRLRYIASPGGPNPPTGYSPSISVKDHSSLYEHLQTFGVKLEDINFFKWEAFPERSFGKFLVSEREWLEVAKNGQNENGDPPQLIAGNVYAELTITDGIDTKIFVNLDVVSTSFLMSPLAPTGVTGQDGSRLLVLELELSNRKWYDSYRTYGLQGFWSGAGGGVQNIVGYATSDLTNVHRIPDVSKMEYYAYLASLNFITTYMPSGDINNPTGIIPVTTNDKFVFPTNKQMIYNKVSVTKGPIKFKVAVPSDDWCSGTYYESEEVLAVNGSDMLYASPVNSKSDVQEIEVVLGYTMVDHLKVAFNSSHGDLEAARLANLLKPNIQVRLFRNVDILYQGVVTGNLTNDVQRITYRFEGNRLGLRTRLQTVPWKIHNPILQTIQSNGVSTLYRGVLLSNMPNGIAAIFSMETGNNGYQGLQEYEKIVKDKIGIFSNLKAGDKILLERDATSCNYYIVNAQCPSTTPPTPPPTGSCCVPVFPVLGSGFNTEFTVCYGVVSQNTCNNLGGTWTLNGTCPNPPYCEEA